MGDTSVNGRRPGGREPLRAGLGIVLAIGLAGTGLELLLLEHTEDALQWIPVVLTGAALAVLAWHAAGRGPASLKALRGLMLLFLIGGPTGLVLHYRGNVEFELERSPGLGGWPLFTEAMMGATPALAPGAMILLGLIGLLYCWNHPDLRSPPDTTS